MASDTTTAAAAPEEAEVVEEYESDPDEVKRSLVMRRREASDDEDEQQRESERQRNRRVHIHTDDESESQGGAPADYADEEEEEDEGELEEEEEEGDVYEGEEEEEGYEEEERNDGKVKVKGMVGADGEMSTEGVVGLSTGNNENGNDDEKNDLVEEEGMEEEKKESNEPFAVPTAGAFYMHDDRFRDNVGGRNRRAHGGRKLWESKDERKWGHDKFEEMTVQFRHYEEGRRTSRGRYGGHGKNQGPDQAYPRGNRSRAFNNNNNNQNQAPKGVRGRGPRKYEPTWKNSNQAPQPRNKQSGKPLEKTSHSNSRRAFTPMSNSESVTASTRKLVFASSLSSASPPFYPGSSNKDITLPQKKDVQSGSTSRKLQNSGMDENFSMQHANAMHRGKNIADVSMDKLYLGDSSASSAVKPLNSLQMPPSSQSRALGQGVAVPQQITYQPAAPHNKTNRGSSTKLQAVQRSPSQSRIQIPVQSTTQQLGQRSASGSQASSPKAASAINSNDSGEVDSSSESSKLKSALLGKGKGSQGRGSFLYGGAPVMGAAGNMSVGHGDQNFPAFLPVMQFGGQHPGGIPAVGMAFPGYVGQPQLGVGNSEMTWLPVLAGAAGALGATYCPPYIAVDGAYNARPTGQTSGMGSSTSGKESNTNKPGNEWMPSQRPESGSDEYVQQQDKPQPRRYSAMNLANDVLR